MCVGLIAGGIEESAEEEQADNVEKQADQMSTATSEHETMRLKTMRLVSQWSERIWGQECRQLQRMNRWVRFFCVVRGPRTSFTTPHPTPHHTLSRDTSTHEGRKERWRDRIREGGREGTEGGRGGREEGARGGRENLNTPSPP